MTIQNASAILQRLGPCRFALDPTVHGDLAVELALMGCEAVDVDSLPPSPPPHINTAGLLTWDQADTGPTFAAALHRFAGCNVLALHSDGQDRTALEKTLFASSWQRHPAGMPLGEYGAFTARVLPPISYWRRAGAAATGCFTEGVSADPVIARYALAANHVRPSDRVLIDGPHAKDGAAILEALSRAGSVVDGDWRHLPEASVDLIVSFQSDAPADWPARLGDYARVLKHDGRLILGWRQGHGAAVDPARWPAFEAAVDDAFLPEARFVQIPVSPDLQGPHALVAIPVEHSAPTDWMIIIASANPLLGEATADRYDHPAYSRSQGKLPALVDFGDAYDNPWLYRTMVQMGERLGHEMKLARLAECVIEDSREDSADRGAALAVLGYRVLEMRRADLAQAVLPLVEAYAGSPLPEDTPVHVRRWRISLAFLAGRLNELIGERVTAKRWYRSAADADWADFSPLLATKSIAAAFYEARIHLADGDPQTALACFRHGADTALKAAAFPHGTQMGPDGQPLPFYLQELAEVIDMGSQCANALAHFPLWQRDPGLFWRQVDVRRFGLASWARDLERENAQLRAA